MTLLFALFVIIMLPFALYSEHKKKRQKEAAETERRERQRREAQAELQRIEAFKREQERLEAEQELRIEAEKKHLVERRKAFSPVLEERRKKSLANNPDLVFFPVLDVFPIDYLNEKVEKYIAYDLETTGLNPEKSRIIEMGALKIHNGVVLETFTELVRPKMAISQRITELTGITKEMVQNCRTIEQVLPDFVAFTEGLPMVAHNAEFDYSFLKEKHKQLTGETFSRKHYCTMTLYRKFYRLSRGYKPTSAKLMDALHTVFGFDYYWGFQQQCHRTLIDSIAVMELFELIGGA